MNSLLTKADLRRMLGVQTFVFGMMLTAGILLILAVAHRMAS